MSRRLALAALVLCVVIPLLAQAGCTSAQSAAPEGGTGSSSVASPATEPAESTAEEEPGGPAKVGEELSAGPWLVKVDSVSSEQQAPGQVSPAAGKEFMFVEVQLSNTGSGTLQIVPEDFTMTDSSGAAMVPFGKRQAYNAVAMSPLDPKYGTNTTFIYEVTPGSTGYTFTFSPEIDGAKAALVWTVP